VTAEVVARNNEGVGLMGQFDFDRAVSAFEGLRVAHPSWPGGRLNLAIALMNRQGSTDAARAETELRSLIDVPEMTRRARYTLALLLVHEGHDAEALPLLASVAEGQPPDGFAAYFAGQLQLAKDPAGALQWYQRAIAQAPLLRSAYYGAFLSLRRLGRDDEAATMLSRFQALERNPQALVAEFKYTRMGPLAEAVTVDEPEGRAVSIPTGPRFRTGVPLVAGAGPTWKAGGPPRSITVADIDGDGALDVFLAGALQGPVSNAVAFRRGDRWVADVTHPLASVADVRAAIWADLDDNGLVDVVLCKPAGGTAIWRQTAAGQWSAAAGLARDAATRRQRGGRRGLRRRPRRRSGPLAGQRRWSSRVAQQRRGWPVPFDWRARGHRGRRSSVPRPRGCRTRRRSRCRRDGDQGLAAARCLPERSRLVLSARWWRGGLVGGAGRSGNGR
jgi:tetratricopeptide (TPR) repeat protein